MSDPSARALIFDMDGTLVRSEHLHRESWTGPLAELGFSIDDETYARHYAGRPGMQIIRDQIGLEGEAATVLYENVTTAYWELAADQLHPMPGLLSLLDRALDVRLAVCTSAQRDSAHRMLDVLGIRDRFGAIITATDVVHGKPNPEPFLLSAEAIGVEPTMCVAFEDSANGLISAKRAGMISIGIGDGIDHYADLADDWITDFTDPGINLILSKAGFTFGNRMSTG